MGIPEVQELFHSFDGTEVYYLLYIGGELSREAKGSILGSFIHPTPTQTKLSLPWPGSQEITGIPVISRIPVYTGVLLLNPPIADMQDCK